MTTTLLTCTLAALLSGDPEPSKDKPREPNQFAPSLPQLTDAEEEHLDQIIDRFIKYDVGEIGGAEGLKARKEFDKLGPEATFALIRGLNKAAQIEHSCPAVTIAKKLSRILGSTTDTELLQFARENIGSGVGDSRHGGLLRDLRVACTIRKNLLARQSITTPMTPSTGTASSKPLRSMSIGELAEAAGSERGARLKQVLAELEQRRGDEVLATLAGAATAYESDIQQLARDHLVSNLARQSTTAIKAKLKDDKAEIRAAAARVVGKTAPALGGEVINLLTDDEKMVRDAAHEALVKLNRGTDLGPEANARDEDRAAAVKKWRDWWTKQSGR
jgi:hypothetical protein